MRANQLQVQARVVPFWKQMSTIGRSLIVIQQVQKNEGVSKSQIFMSAPLPFPYKHPEPARDPLPLVHSSNSRHFPHILQLCHLVPCEGLPPSPACLRRFEITIE